MHAPPPPATAGRGRPALGHRQEPPDLEPHQGLPRGALPVLSHVPSKAREKRRKGRRFLLGHALVWLSLRAQDPHIPKQRIAGID